MSITALNRIIMTDNLIIGKHFVVSWSDMYRTVENSQSFVFKMFDIAKTLVDYLFPI